MSDSARMRTSPEVFVSAGLRVLVVENHPDTLASLQLYLESLGHTVSVARTVSDALEKLPVANVQMLISDIGLPDGTGWDLMERAKLPPHVFAVAMSGFGMNADSVRSKSVGFRHHLLKPFNLQEFDKVLEEAALTGNP